MPRDYKNINKSKKKQPNPLVGNLISFLTGLTVGLFIAFLVYLDKIHIFDGFGLPDMFSREQAQESAPAGKKEEKKNIPSPTFDFYKILPNKEINISEYVADDQPAAKQEQDTDEEGLYVLQVGSFKDYDAADSVKAKLSLMGIVPEIQRVVINGQDVRYRVRVGPFKDRGKLAQTRYRLKENEMNYMLLKLKSDGN